MSIQAVAWVLEKSQAALGERLVLLAIANRAERDGTDAWPGVPSIAKQARLSERQVYRILPRLLASGELHECQAPSGRGNRRIFCLPAMSGGCGKGDNTADPGAAERVTSTPRKGDIHARERVTSLGTPTHGTVLSTVHQPSLTTYTLFTRFWAAYPRKAAKRKAAAAFERATHRAPFEAILQGAQRYRDDPNRESQFTKGPEAWLNGDCWEDDPLPARAANGYRHPNDRRMDIIRKLKEAEREQARRDGDGDEVGRGLPALPDR